MDPTAERRSSDDGLRVQIIDHLTVARSLTPQSGGMLRYLIDMALMEAAEADYLKAKADR